MADKMTLEGAGKILDRHSKEKPPRVKTGFAKVKDMVVDAYLRYDRNKRKKKQAELLPKPALKKREAHNINTDRLLKQVDD